MRSTPAVSVRPALFVLAALAALASCMKKDPDFCCSTQESCSRNGGPGVLTIEGESWSAASSLLDRIGRAP